MSYQSFVLVGDNHGSFTCPEWKRAVLKFCKDVRPDRRFHVGDAYDFSCLRRGADASEKRESVKEDLEMGTQFLIEYFGQEGAKNKGDVLTWGNHDDRIFVTAATGTGMVAEYASSIIKEIKKTCKSLRLTTTEYSIRKNAYEIAPGKFILHGFFSGATTAPRKSAQTFGNCISGHIHSFAYWKEPNILGSEAYVVGCGSTICNGEANSYNARTPGILSHERGWYYGVIETKSGDWVLWKIIQSKTNPKKWLNPLKMIK
tara:strand:+ start:2006 stop:2782 length:777 start_codon:yes stop_codon:yes gene_type:complete